MPANSINTFSKPFSTRSSMPSVGSELKRLGLKTAKIVAVAAVALSMVSLGLAFSAGLIVGTVALSSVFPPAILLLALVIPVIVGIIPGGCELTIYTIFKMCNYLHI